MTVFSKFADETVRIKVLLKQKEKVWPPPISFAELVRESRPKAKDGSKSSIKMREFEIPIDLEDYETTTFKKKVTVFDNGRPLQWVRWRIELETLFIELGYKYDVNKQHHLYMNLMEGHCLEAYQEAYNCCHQLQFSNVPIVRVCRCRRP